MGQLQTQHEMTMSFYSEFGDLNVYAKQGDTQRFIQFEFTEEVIPEGLDHFYAYIRGKYPDGSVIPVVRINQSDIHEDYILFQIPSTLLALPGKVVCDLVLCRADSQPTIDPETGTIDDSGVEILSTHTFNIFVEAMATSGGSISEHTADQAAELVRLIIATEALIEVVEENEEQREEAEEARAEAELEREEAEESRVKAETERSDAEIIRDVNENGGSEELSDGTTYEVDYEDSRVGAEEIRQENEEERIANEERREDAEQGYVAQAKSYAIGDEVARPGSATDNSEFYYQLSKEAVYGKGVMELTINNDGHLIYKRTDDLDTVNFIIEDHRDLIITFGTPTKITPPTVTSNLTYNGEIQRPTISNYPSNSLIFSGVKQAINAGTYQMYCTPAPGYEWNGDYPEFITYEWSIVKADRTISLSKSSLYAAPTDTLNLTYNGGGRIEIQNLDGSKFSAKVVNKDVTIKALAPEGESNITILVHPDNNYNSVTSETINVKGVKIVSWSSGTDTEIVDMVNSADYGVLDLTDYWHVGDERTVSLPAMEATYVNESHVAQDAILVLTHSGDHKLVTPTSGGKTYCSFDVQVKNLMSDPTSSTQYTNPEAGYINSTTTNQGGWRDSLRRKWCNEVFDINSPIKQIFKTFECKSMEGNGSTNIIITQDKFALPACIEVGGNEGSAYREEGEKWDYYTDISNRVKVYNNGTGGTWWLRSSNIYNNFSFKNVETTGATNVATQANAPSGIAPFGCI